MERGLSKAPAVVVVPADDEPSRLGLRCGRCRTPLRLALLVRCVRCRMPLRLALLVLPARLDAPRAGIARGA
jgi:hypothetical protein